MECQSWKGQLEVIENNIFIFSYEGTEAQWGWGAKNFTEIRTELYVKYLMGSAMMSVI